LALTLPAAPPDAHAFGARYDLPLPLALYLVGAGAAVALSFVIMALVFRVRAARTDRLRIDLLRFRSIRVLLHPVVIGVLQGVSVGLFLLVLAAGLFGTQDTLDTIAPTFIWIIWWVGLAYVAALAGNLWPAVNPWSIVSAAGGLPARITPSSPSWSGTAGGHEHAAVRSRGASGRPRRRHGRSPGWPRAPGPVPRGRYDRGDVRPPSKAMWHHLARPDIADRQLALDLIEDGRAALDRLACKLGARRRMSCSK
jgi:hypothetical protein